VQQETTVSAVFMAKQGRLLAGFLAEIRQKQARVAPLSARDWN
jgi:hypothetical protein